MLPIECFFYYIYIYVYIDTHIYVYIFPLSIHVPHLKWLSGWTAVSSIIITHFILAHEEKTWKKSFSRSDAALRVQRCIICEALQRPGVTLSCYLLIREDIYWWYGAAVNLSALRLRGVQFTNWKIMRVIMAMHSLKFKRWAPPPPPSPTPQPTHSSLVSEMTRRRLFEYYLIILTQLIMGKKLLLPSGLNVLMLRAGRRI